MKHTIYIFLTILKTYQMCNNNFLNYLNEKESKEILIIEKYPYHGECLPGFIKYFFDLGYKNIDILINENLNKLNPLNISFLINKINIFEYSSNLIEKFITLGMCNFYKICLFTTLEFELNDKIRLYLYQKTKFKKIIVFHELKNINKNDTNYYNIIVLKKLKKNIPVFEINPHFFGNYKFHNKQKITNFITVGNIETFRKNFFLLFENVEKLIKNNILNFHVTVIGGGEQIFLNITKKNNLNKYIKFTGRIPYDLMFQYLSNADFFLPLLDPEKHEIYLKEKTSGSFQLVYGFNIPMIIEKNFAEKYGFNNLNSVIYDTNKEFFNKLNYSIYMKNDEYINIKYNLKLKTKEIEKISIKNLKFILNY